MAKLAQQPFHQCNPVKKKAHLDSRDLKSDLNTVVFCLGALCRKIVVRYLTFFVRL